MDRSERDLNPAYASVRPETGLATRGAVEVRAGIPVSIACDVVVEEPLEIRVAGETVALTMRTPGDDRYLALGFLRAEGVLESLADVSSVYHCGRIGDPRRLNTLEVVPAPGAALDVDRLLRARRVGVTTSACGVCGRDGIDDLLERMPMRSTSSVPAALLELAPARLLAHQRLFARSGGSHAACALDRTGCVLAHFEDVGRHNAVDKVVGKLMYDAAESASTLNPPLLLAVSGRASFEIVQKAAVAGFSCVASVSAPSSLAIDAAAQAGVMLAAFVREGQYTIYTHAQHLC